MRYASAELQQGWRQRRSRTFEFRPRSPVRNPPMPVLSVVIPTRNRARLLARAVGSVVNQSNDAWELVIVDDASSDDTSRVARSLADSDVRIRSLRQDTARGAPAARNRGMVASTADLVAFLDDDDIWDPSFVDRMVAALERSGAGLAYCDSSYEKRSGDRRLHLKHDISEDPWRELIRGNALGSTPCVIVRRAALMEVGGFDERLPRLQDWDLWLRLARVTRFVYVPEPLVRVAETKGGITSRGDALAEAISIVRKKHTPLLTDRAATAAFLHTLGHLGMIGGAPDVGAALLREAAAVWPLPPWRGPMALLATFAPSTYRAISGMHADYRERRPDPGAVA